MSVIDRYIIDCADCTYTNFHLCDLNTFYARCVGQGVGFFEPFVSIFVGIVVVLLAVGVLVLVFYLIDFIKNAKGGVKK